MSHLSIVALFAASSLSAQTSGTVRGRISDGMRPSNGELIVVRSSGTVHVERFATDNQGTFSIELPAGRTVLVARAAGHVSEEREILVRPGTGNPAVQFTLPAAGSVSGRVVDETGAPAAGARVWVVYPGAAARSWRVAEEAGGEPADARGAFAVPLVARGRPFVLYTETAGRLFSRSGTFVLLGAEMGGVTLTAGGTGATVRGRVVDRAGNPITGATVRLRIFPADGEFTAEERALIPFARSLHRLSVSSRDGSYSFDGLPSGRVVVTADDGHRRAARELALSGPESAVLLILY